MSGEPMDDQELVEALGYVPCTAKSKQSQQRCRRRPVPGLSVCVMHGGKTPAAQEKAAEVVQAAAADSEIRKLWVGLDEATAVADPVASLAKLAGALEAMLDEVGATVNTIKTTAAGANLSQVRGEIVLLERVASLLGRTLDSMARLGIAERQIELQADQAALVTSAYRAALGVVAASVLLPADRDLMLRTFLTHLGVQLDELEAGGAA